MIRTLALFSLLAVARAADVDWPAYLGDKASSQYSSLGQITPDNVARLEVAWTFRAGGADGENRSQIQCNPLVVDGVLYGTSPDFQLFALDAASGEEKWRFDPAGEGLPKGGVNRGLVHWGHGDEARIFYANDHFLHAIDARTGKRIAGFGQAGSVDLKDGLGRDAGNLYLAANTPGVIFRDLLIMGMRLGEGPAPAAPGHVRAYDVRTGQLRWRFNTIPLPGEEGHESWPPEAHRSVGGANVWSGFALDEARGLVFCPTGSAAFDFWGGDRIGENLFANCLIALDANTGKRKWHFQFVHHDLWDRDLPAPPNLVTVKRDGKRIDAVAQVTKSGHVFVFDRETGEPLFPVEERPVPPSALQGESAWPTQPFPLKPAPFARQVFDESQITDLSPESRAQVSERFRQVTPHVPFAPPSERGTIIFPGFDGGGEWGGAAVDPDGILYVNANEMAWILTMVPTATGGSAASGAALFTQLCAACHGVDRRGNPAQNVPSLVDVGQRLKQPEVLALLKTGKGVMPSFDFLSGEQKQKVVDHLFGGAPAGNEAGRKEEPGGEAGAMGKIPYTTTGYNRWLDPDGYPAVKPPWGTLHAIDLNRGEFQWSVPLGEYPELSARGIPKTGTENYGGPVVTAGGLIFIAASRDEHLRAFDRRSGKELWKARLPAAGYATPATYSVNGRQYVVIACGGGKIGTRSSDAYVAFALPE
ncbi:PQQ-binding-like beta-propeller repeat protein [Luteolibacter marinus]|uniref:outer membrane protein assembly factor BamB family protein n=1 Tax=Luteolibacter marinus TaxID=2776705 RepID=UPI00186751D4|nr:PQQ-binding-like beta-propeller repeat protein [Luteolibacter marinus]